MAYRKASDEQAAVALGSDDFWAAVQNGGDVRISVADILAYLRTVLVTGDIAELPGKLQAISDKAAGDVAAVSAELDTALGQLNGSVAQSITDLQTDVNTRATKTELDTAVGTLQADVNTRATKAQLGTVAGKNTGVNAGQIPILGSDGKLDTNIIPAVAITDTFPVASQTEMLALTAERGDIAIRSDLNKCFVLKVEPATVLANWKELLTPTDAVLSVAGCTGAITAAALKSALAIAISDVGGLQAALDALSAADTKLRTDFQAADTSIRTDFAAADAAEAKARADADALKFDKAGGNVSGNVIASGTVQGNAVTAQSAADAIVYLESTAAPTTSFRQKRIYSSNNVGGGNDWLFRAMRPSDGAIQDWTLKDGTGGTIWTTGNFDPATKANVSGQNFSGAISAPAVAVPRTTTNGGLNLTAGDASHSGYLEFFPAGTGTRHGYVGYSDGTNIILAAEVGRFNFTGNAPAVGGNLIWHAGTFDPSTKANVAGQTFSGAIAAPGVTTTGNLGLSGIGTNLFKAGTLDGASYSDANARLRLHWGLGVEDNTGVINGFYDARAGRWDTKSAPRVNGNDVWHPGNFDPASKLGFTTGGNVTAQTVFKGGPAGNVAGRPGDGAILQVRSENGDAAAMNFHRAGQYAVWFGLDTDNEFVRGGWSDGAARYKFWTEKNFNPGTKADKDAYNAFTGIGLTGSETYLYHDANVHNFVVRTGSSSSGYKYSAFGQDGVFQGASHVRATGDFITPGRLVVGEGQVSSYIEMRDTDEGTRYIHNNSGSIGFLGSDGGWKLRSFDDGNIWSPMFGYLSDAFAAKAPWKAPAFGNGIRIEGNQGKGDAGSWPYLSLWKGGYWHWQLTVDDGSSLLFRNGDDGTNRMLLNSSGQLWLNNYGWLHDYVNGRASAYSSERVSRYGDTMTGNLVVGKTYPQTSLLWSGVMHGGWMLDSDASLMWRNVDNGAVYFRIRPSGAIETAQFGDLGQRIEDRAWAWADQKARDYTNACVSNLRFVYAGDLNGDWNTGGGMGSPYGGNACVVDRCTAWNGANDIIVTLRWRYLQQYIPNQGWVTVGAAS